MVIQPLSTRFIKPNYCHYVYRCYHRHYHNRYRSTKIIKIVVIVTAITTIFVFNVGRRERAAGNWKLAWASWESQEWRLVFSSNNIYLPSIFVLVAKYTCFEKERKPLGVLSIFTSWVESKSHREKTPDPFIFWVRKILAFTLASRVDCNLQELTATFKQLEMENKHAKGRNGSDVEAILIVQ